jgi:hypothetical protein
VRARSRRGSLLEVIEALEELDRVSGDVIWQCRQRRKNDRSTAVYRYSISFDIAEPKTSEEK